MSYEHGQDLTYRNKDQIVVLCDNCGTNFRMLYKSAEANKKKYGLHKCHQCTGFVPKPQNKSEFWTLEKKQEHADKIRNSKNYQDAIKKINRAGKNNAMFGRPHSDRTKAKMSKSRLGKIGTKATAWKGGKCSVVKRVKGIIHGRYNWYGRVYERDAWKCVHCGCNKKIDAHHIIAINQLVKNLCKDKSFSSNDEKVAWLVEQPEIIDQDLKNGITLCRECHKKEHNNWGSHACR